MIPLHLVLLAWAGLAAAALAARPQPLKLTQTIPLPGVQGRIDHLALDAPGQRLFVAALGNDTLEVVDLAQGRRVQSVAGLSEPQGLAFAPERGLLVVANGRDGSVTFLDGRTFERLRRVELGQDADNVRLEPGASRVWVGYGTGALAAIDLESGAITDRIPLPGHPESFQLERGGNRIFVNVPTARAIVVVDRQAKRVAATWPVSGASENFPMALDEEHHRLFIACRRPARLLVYDTQSGDRVAEAPLVGDCDDVFCDPARKRLFASGGQGELSVLDAGGSDHYSLLGSIPTAPGARTSLFSAEPGRLYLAVPHRGAQPAEVRVFALEP